MNYVLDTNIVSLWLRHDGKVSTRLRQTLTPDNVVIACPIVWYEVRRGLLAKGATIQLKGLENLFASFMWQDYIHADWLLAADLWKQRRAMGIPVADADLLIGVFARNRTAILVTNNEKDFVHLGVRIENWTK